MPINLTKVYGRVNDVKKKLFYGKDENNEDRAVTFMHLNEIIAVITNGWYLATTTSSDFITGQEFFELTISDIDDAFNLSDVIPDSPNVKIGGVTYKVTQYTRPRGLTEQWVLKISPTGKRETSGS